MYKVDLHTHSEASHDGGISAEQYAKLLEQEIVDYIAITDHNRIDFALGMQKALGNRIIVGEEIMTVEGEIIGLFLKENILPNLSVEETIAEIRRQNGAVYIPHPFEKARKGLSQTTVMRIIDDIDIIEVYNARAVLRAKHGAVAMRIARQYRKGASASSDAHGYKGVGTSYNILPEAPNIGNLEQHLMNGKMHCERPLLRTLLYPKAHKVKNTFRRAPK